MTRQPADAKRFTVAWPMPREAPVRMSVLRSLGLVDDIVVSGGAGVYADGLT